MIQYSYKHILRVQVITRFRLTYIAHSQTKSEYAYTTGTPGDPLSTVNYSYGNSDWKDLLTGYNGIAISYDLSGNPLNWRNASALTWNGRRLAGMTLTDGTGLAFEYNSAGIRIGKTVGSDKTVEYLLDGTKIIREIRKVNGIVTETLLYYYNTDGDVIGLSYNGTDYYYGRNMQGDILYIYNTSGEIVTTYVYDAWGSVISQTGTLSSTVGEANPFRYRGYYLDSETGLYYLQSRYYDAAVGRFLNADDVSYVGVGSTIQSLNIFVYCENNPTAQDDASGYGPIKAIGLQVSMSIKSMVIGLEILWDTSKWKPYLFFFAGGGSRNLFKSSAKTLENTLTKSIGRTKNIKMGALNKLSKFGLSISFVAVIGNKYAKFPDSYSGWFTSASFSIKHFVISGGIGIEGNAVIGSFCLGVTTNTLPSCSISQTFYWQVTGKNPFSNIFSPLKRNIYNKLGWLTLFSSLLL